MSGFLVRLLRPVSFRGKYRLLNPIVPRSGERTMSLFGSEIKLDLSDDMQRWIYLGIFGGSEMGIVRERLGPGMTFLDIGANVGFFTLLSASLVGPSGRVFAVEPSPHVANRMIEATKRNRLEQVRVETIGLSDHNGEITLYIPPASERNHSPTMVAVPETSWQAVTVPVKTLDDCLTEWGAGTVDLMKVDVEGHEPAVFRGGAKALAEGRIRSILCEFNEPYLRAAGGSPESLLRQLQELGFTLDPSTPFRTDTPVIMYLLNHQSSRPDALSR